ncbi:MAG TPA: metallophosphoesterase [Bacteroidota bacterium]|nr:metallophosphoesterase [Bacteroidota bacterium]
MKVARVLLFFVVVFAIYFSVNAYVLHRGVHCFPPGTAARTIVLWTGVFLILSFIAGRVLERFWLSHVSDLFVWIGSFWLGAMLYLFLAAVLIDLVRLVHGFVPILPDSWMEHPERTARLTFWIVTGLVGILLVAGHVNARTPRIHHLALQVSKSVPGVDSIRIAMASDIHLGTLVGRKRLGRIAEAITTTRPDLVLFPGDIVDEDLAPVIKENLGETLRSITAPMGVFGITGNHEYIGGAEEAVAYLEEHGIQMLRDTCIVLRGGITLCGREDRSSMQFGGKRRKALRELLKDVDRTRPVIVMDHQPFELDTVAHAGVDVQLSGHTHHGQLWPLNYVTTLVYEQSWGYLQKLSTHFYVSSGVGSWGPPVRLGNRPEIVVLTLHFNHQ